ncbi:MAG: hypothetical protein KDB79_09055 [Acidobacteria bacterium]|nr:hypothetical protein [Acidobacteriota bacterium]
MLETSQTVPRSWLAFELNILRRLEFSSISMPFFENPQLGRALKSLNVKVVANDLLKSVFVESTAAIENNDYRLSEEEIEIVLEDVYVPQYRLNNPALTNWFSESDAWWFDNVRQNIIKLETPMSRAIALSIGIEVGNYALSFDDQTRELRQPLSNVFKRLWNIRREPTNNGQNNACHNKDANEFIAENYTDLLFLKLPRARKRSLRESLGWTAWREEWIRKSDQFWDDLEYSQRGKLGTRIETKSQYLSLIVEVFKTAQHIDLWAIEHVEDGFIQSQDVVEAISEVRRVDTIYSKDFSELMGTKAVIITA